jgi:arginase
MIYCAGYASGLAGTDQSIGLGPLLIEKSVKDNTSIQWLNHFYPKHINEKSDLLPVIQDCCEKLAQQVHYLVKQKKTFSVVGGDHSVAIGTWSGAAAACEEPLELIWFDAHMDAHTFMTSASKNIHGMPVSVLLGHGEESLVNIMTSQPKIQAQNIHLIGIRDFQDEEKQFLDDLNVNIIYMDEIRKKGINTIIQHLIEQIKSKGNKVGISIDLDVIDPLFAPGVCTGAKDGMSDENLIEAFTKLITSFKDNLLGIEIAEYNPNNDQDDRTLEIAKKILTVFASLYEKDNA